MIHCIIANMKQNTNTNILNLDPIVVNKYTFFQLLAPTGAGSFTASRCTCYHFVPPVNGNWGAWPTWSDCSVTCDEGTKTRTRQCNNPAPAHGGKSCPGTATVTESCDEGPCPGW